MNSSTSPHGAPSALIAEDEPLLAEHLKQSLAKAWPELRIVAVVDNGMSAAQQALSLRPDVLFLDIRMPGQSGLEAATELADAWPDASPFPALVFVTAYDQYAIDAFEAQAIDYVLKPVQPARLAKTVERLQLWLAQRSQAASHTAALEQAVAQLQQLQTQFHPMATPDRRNPAPLQFLRANVGSSIHVIAVEDILFLEAADKYVRVLTQDKEYLLRTPLKELLPQLDEQQFWQIHRGTVVRAAAIQDVQRDEAGKLWLGVRGRTERLAVSRLFAPRFKAM